MLTQPKPKTLRKFALPSLLLALLFSCITVPPAPPGEISGLGARLAERIEKLLIRDKERENIPAVSLAVMDQGEIIWLQSWGQTSLDLSRARPNSPDELFYQGSITKSLTALALIHLQNQGLISIDDPLSRHIPQTQGHPVGNVSIRQIMSHSSGLGVCRI